MRPSRSVCLLCQSKLVAPAVRRAGPAWLARRPVSLLPARDNSTSTGERIQSSPGGDTPTAPSPSFDNHDGNPGYREAPASACQLARKPTSGTQLPESGVIRRAGAPESVPIAAFEKVLKEQQDQETTPSYRPAMSLELYREVAKLEEMMHNSDISTAACLEFFQTHIYHSAQGLSPVPRVLRNSTRILMQRVMQEKEQDLLSSNLPSLTQMSIICRDLDLLIPKYTASMTTSLVEQLCQMSASPQDYPTVEGYENSLAKMDSMALDLVGVWKQFSLSGLGRGVHPKDRNEFRLADVDMKALKRYVRKNQPHLALSLLFPQYEPGQLRWLTTAALGTFTLLTDPAHSNPTIREGAKPFLTSLGLIFACCNLKPAFVRDILKNHTATSQYVLIRWPVVEAQLKESRGTARTDAVIHETTGTSSHRDRSPRSVAKQISYALRMRNPQALERIWAEFWGGVSKPTPQRLEELRSSASVFDYFIMAYTAIRHYDKAVEVWNRMLSIDVKPSIKTWTSMIDGFKQARNPDGIHSAWERALKSGVRLDTHIWTARISGLIESGDTRTGLMALDEMARSWNAAKKSNDPSSTAVAPSIEPVNAALTGLLRLKGVAAAREVLAWAARQGIEPDVITFNTLLRHMIRNDMREEIESVFQMMKQQGVQADVATYTILLEGAIDQLGDDSPENQVRAVTRFLSEMEASGVEANKQTYAKMIHLLLQDGDHTRDAVKAVLAHVWSKGLDLSSHICTILVQHYFSRNPPDLVSVRDLIGARRLHEKGGIDHVFWERVIRGYTQVGDATSAFDIFEKTENSGAIVTLSTLEELLQALLHADRRADAARLVHAVTEQRRRSFTDPGDACRAGFWGHRFWRLAEDYGLLVDDLAGGGGPSGQTAATA